MRGYMKLGMVSEGGANRTIFSCGVMDVFLEEGLMPDYYAGVSAGIAFGVSYLSGQQGRNLKLMETYMSDKRYMGMRHLLNRKKRTYYNTDFVFGEIPQKLLPFDFEAFAAYPGEVEAVVTNLHTGKAEYLAVPRGEDMRDTLVASCALPVLFQPVKVGRHYYLDGGVSDSVPFEHAFAKGCDKVIAVLTRERGFVRRTENAVKLTNRLYRKYPKIVEDMEHRAERYNASMDELRRLEEEGRVFVIAPESTYGVGRTETDTVKLRRLYDEGVRIARERMEALREYLKSGTPGGEERRDL